MTSSTESSREFLRGVDLSCNEIAGIRVSSTFAELKGATISPEQAIDLVGLLGVTISDG